MVDLSMWWYKVLLLSGSNYSDVWRHRVLDQKKNSIENICFSPNWIQSKCNFITFNAREPKKKTLIKIPKIPWSCSRICRIHFSFCSLTHLFILIKRQNTFGNHELISGSFFFPQQIKVAYKAKFFDLNSFVYIHWRINIKKKELLNNDKMKQKQKVNIFLSKKLCIFSFKLFALNICWIAMLSDLYEKEYTYNMIVQCERNFSFDHISINLKWWTTKFTDKCVVVTYYLRRLRTYFSF